jgi:lysophospholipase L1-like esterase
METISRLEKAPQLLIFGEAIMHTILEDKELWVPFQKTYKAINFAMGGERTETLLHRVRFSDWGLLTEGKESAEKTNAPLVIMLMIGTNNIGRGESPEVITTSVDTIVKEFISKITSVTHIFILSILPRAIETFNASIYDANRLLSDKYSETTLLNGAITFVDITPLFKAKDGSIKKNMYMADRFKILFYNHLEDITDSFTSNRFHPSHEGYESMIKAVRPLLDEVFVNAGVKTEKAAVAKLDSVVIESPSKSAAAQSNLDEQIEAAIKLKEKEAGVDSSVTEGAPKDSKRSVFNDLTDSLIDLEKGV